MDTRNKPQPDPAQNTVSRHVEAAPGASAGVAYAPVAEAWRQNLGRTVAGTFAGPRGADWWTGPVPEAGKCPGVGADGRITSLPQPDLMTCTRQDVLDYFDNTWALTEVLFSALANEEAFYRPPAHNLRHPLIFYYGHPAVLYVNKLRVAQLLHGPLNEIFEEQFETGVDEMSWDDLSKNELSWPSVDAVRAYRAEVYKLVRTLIETHPGLADKRAPIPRSSALWALFMGFEHERIHLETSSVLIRELPVALVQRPAGWPADHPTAQAPAVAAPQAGTDFPVNALVTVEAGPARIGKPTDWPSFGWDNAYGERVAVTAEFQASRSLISNGEYFAFVRDGGYRESRWWSEDGWAWRSFRNAKWPVFWVPDGPAGLHAFKLRGLFTVHDLPWSWPAEVNFYEAQAFAAWQGAREGVVYRLPTETEHQRLRDPGQSGLAGRDAYDPVMHLTGREFAAQGRNINLAFGSPSPVDAGPLSAAGFSSVFGNTWQWHADHFHPLPGFRVDPLYEDFSAPCFDGRHQMILGGSFMSSGEVASIWARYHFRPHFFQHAGFRLVTSQGASDAIRLDFADEQNVYESRQVLGEYMLLHFGAVEDVMPYAFGPRDAVDFPTRCAQLVLDSAARAGIATGRALDVGCAVGRSVFELARGFEEVIGIDLSRSFIDAADALRRDGQHDYWRKDEGNLGIVRTASVDAAIDRGRVSFQVGDACALPADLQDFDAVLMANLLCRLPDPRACLDRLTGPQGLVRPGGLLVLASPYTWMEKFTPADAWLGGFTRATADAPDGQEAWSRDGLVAWLSPEFDLLHEEDMPLVIREHVRKYQYIVSHAMVWRRKSQT